MSKGTKEHYKMEKRLVMESRPNTLSTFNDIMELAHMLQEKNGKVYYVEIDFKSDSVKLFMEVE